MKNSSVVFFSENSVNGAGREKTEERNKEEKKTEKEKGKASQCAFRWTIKALI